MNGEDTDSMLVLLDELRILATIGLRYADNPYNEQRYERILELVSEWYGRSVDLPATEVRERFAAELGYVTPKPLGKPTNAGNARRDPSTM